MIYEIIVVDHNQLQSDYDQTRNKRAYYNKKRNDKLSTTMIFFAF